jgi:hypothetical protein
MTFDFDPIFTLLFNTETIRPMSIKIKVSLPLGIEEKQQVGPLFRQPIAPTAHFSDNPLFRQKWSKVV